MAGSTDTSGGARRPDALHSEPLRRDFADRDELVAYCRDVFPAAAEVDDHVSATRGGPCAAEARLAEVDPPRYGRTRNALDGAVTGLSPYLRHGVVGLAETRDLVIETAGSPRAAYKLLQELAWRDYYRRVLDDIGDDVWDDLEEWKTGYHADHYADELPEDFLRGETGNDFVDHTVHTLHETGYLHNQLRMKIAAYVVHWRRVKWQAGAAWMLSHLLDGDLASNNLSWQWVASTFGPKPYLFNEENLVKVTGGRLQGVGPGGQRPFAGSYDELNERLFERR
ncbi:FAD-binding domain-containing protein [Botrimarina sp.]|uniref:FAD-binding domain-containing protein n=1 Tax=Botrimarina sp. TaxID=2795802 RepID=UPI0032EC4C18